MSNLVDEVNSFIDSCPQAKALLFSSCSCRHNKNTKTTINNGNTGCALNTYSILTAPNAVEVIQQMEKIVAVYEATRRLFKDHGRKLSVEAGSSGGCYGNEIFNNTSVRPITLRRYKKIIAVLKRKLYTNPIPDEEVQKFIKTHLPSRSSVPAGECIPAEECMPADDQSDEPISEVVDSPGLFQQYQEGLIEFRARGRRR